MRDAAKPRTTFVRLHRIWRDYVAAPGAATVRPASRIVQVSLPPSGSRLRAVIYALPMRVQVLELRKMFTLG